MSLSGCPASTTILCPEAEVFAGYQGQEEGFPSPSLEAINIWLYPED